MFHFDRPKLKTNLEATFLGPRLGGCFLSYFFFFTNPQRGGDYGVWKSGGHSHDPMILVPVWAGGFDTYPGCVMVITGPPGQPDNDLNPLVHRVNQAIPSRTIHG